MHRKELMKSEKKYFFLSFNRMEVSGKCMHFSKCEPQVTSTENIHYLINLRQRSALNELQTAHQEKERKRDGVCVCERWRTFYLRHSDKVVVSLSSHVGRASPRFIRIYGWMRHHELTYTFVFIFRRENLSHTLRKI